ncbi:beta catenin antagonist chibby [Glossina fuscipes fuscipes]
MVFLLCLSIYYPKQKVLQVLLVCLLSVKMPLFNKKFESKPILPRTLRSNSACPLVTEELDDYKQISLNLGNKELRFIDGIWIHTNRKGAPDDVTRLNRRLKSLEEKCNMRELKVEVLLDLLTEHATELTAFKAKEN